jgi:hypothetical protein
VIITTVIARLSTLGDPARESVACVVSIAACIVVSGEDASGFV